MKEKVMRIGRKESAHKRLRNVVAMWYCFGMNNDRALFKFKEAVVRRSIFILMLTFFGGVAEANVFQYDATGFEISDGVAVWKSANGKSALASARSDWDVPQKINNVVRFDAATPMRFAKDSATNAVAYAMAVVSCDAEVDTATGNIRNVQDFNGATLINAPGAVRFTANKYATNVLAFAQAQLAGEVRVSVSPEETELFVPMQELQLVEAEFVTSCTTDKIYVGGSPASLKWDCQWKGGVAEILFFADMPSQKERDCVAFYLRKKWRLDVAAPNHADLVPVLRALGVHTGGMFEQTIFVR